MKISIIGIEGASCGVQTVSAAAVETGGTVNLVNPLELQRQVRSIIDNPPIGFNVSVELQMHSSLGFMRKYNQQDKKNLESLQKVLISSLSSSSPSPSLYFVFNFYILSG